MSRRIVGSKPDHLAIVCGCLVQPAGPGKEIAEIIVRRGIIGFELNRLFIVGGRRCVSPESSSTGEEAGPRSRRREAAGKA